MLAQTLAVKNVVRIFSMLVFLGLGDDKVLFEVKHVEGVVYHLSLQAEHMFSLQMISVIHKIPVRFRFVLMMRVVNRSYAKRLPDKTDIVQEFMGSPVGKIIFNVLCGDDVFWGQESRHFFINGLQNCVQIQITGAGCLCGISGLRKTTIFRVRSLPCRKPQVYGEAAYSGWIIWIKFHNAQIIQGVGVERKRICDGVA